MLDASTGTPDTRGGRSRRAIVSSARARFAAHGFDETTLGDVAADAGVSGPTVTFHFGSKLGLLAAVIDDYYEQLLPRLDAAIDAPSAPTERLAAFARFWLEAIDGDFALFGVFAAHGWMRETTTETGVAMRRNNTQITRRFERLVDDLKAEGSLRADVSTRLVRDAFFGTAEHVLRGQLHSSRPLDHRHAAEQVLGLVLHGAAARPRTATDEDRLRSVERKLDLLLSRRPAADEGSA